jgi:biotin-dependent carboxylase-like uncharacterized protein
MTLVVVKPGALTTVQDRGRAGFRHLGVGQGGALDAFSARIANLLAGNAEEAALLEITLAGPTLRFERGARIAVAGASVDARIDGIALPGWRPLDLPAGSELRLGGCRDGARAYLAIAGGFAVAPVMGSRATDVRAGLGGFEGRALRAGDRLAFAAREVETLAIAPWWLDPRPDLEFGMPALAHLLAGRDALSEPQRLFAAEWRIGSASDRQGLRLAGPRLQAADPSDRVSAPVAAGAVQLPPDGQPIVLLGEAQTVGGYPVVGQVASADLPRLAQCRPGEVLRFAPIDRGAALARLRAQAHRIERMRIAVAAKGTEFPPGRRPTCPGPVETRE